MDHGDKGWKTVLLAAALTCTAYACVLVAHLRLQARNGPAGRDDIDQDRPTPHIPDRLWLEGENPPVDSQDATQSCWTRRGAAISEDVACLSRARSRRPWHRFVIDCLRAHRPMGLPELCQVVGVE
jgi:hypothetical protein